MSQGQGQVDVRLELLGFLNVALASLQKAAKLVARIPQEWASEDAQSLFSIVEKLEGLVIEYEEGR